MKFSNILWRIILLLALGILGAAVILGCCDDDDPSTSSGQADDDDDDDDDDDYNDDVIPTTLDVTFVPVESSPGEWEVAEGPGEPHYLRNDLWVEPTLTTGGKAPLSINYFMTLSDLHITDEEAPTRLTFFDSREVLFGLFEAAFRPQEDLAPHILNAVLRTANRIQKDYGRDFDFALVVGDATDNGQLNEMKTVMDIIDGTGDLSGKPGWARLDSGDLDIDAGTGLNNGERNFEIQEFDNDGENINAFERPGYPNSNADMPVIGLLSASGDPIPWFLAIGNHDTLNTGNFNPDSPLTFYSRDDYVGDICPFGYIPGIASAIEYWEDNPGAPLHIDGGLFGLIQDWAVVIGLLNAFGVLGENWEYDLDPRFDLMTLINDTPEDGSDDGVVIAGDLDREFLGHEGLISMVNAAGHGFADNNNDTKVDAADGGWYRAELPGNMPLRLLVLDSTEVPLTAEGGMSDTQLDWLQSELNQAVADQVLVIVMNHHYSDGITAGGKRFSEVLANCPNVFLHLVGHGHHNTVIPHRNSGDGPAVGYWEVQTPSTIEFPQQWRVFEIVDNRDGTGTIYITNVDHWETIYDDADDLAILGYQLGFTDVLPNEGVYDPNSSVGGRGRFTDRNVALKFAIPAGVAVKFAAIPSDGVITSTDVFGTLYQN